MAWLCLQESRVIPIHVLLISHLFRTICLEYKLLHLVAFIFYRYIMIRLFQQNGTATSNACKKQRVLILRVNQRLKVIQPLIAIYIVNKRQ